MAEVAAAAALLTLAFAAAAARSGCEIRFCNSAASPPLPMSRNALGRRTSALGCDPFVWGSEALEVASERVGPRVGPAGSPRGSPRGRGLIFCAPWLSSLLLCSPPLALALTSDEPGEGAEAGERDWMCRRLRSVGVAAPAFFSSSASRGLRRFLAGDLTSWSIAGALRSGSSRSMSRFRMSRDPIQRSSVHATSNWPLPRMLLITPWHRADLQWAAPKV